MRIVPPARTPTWGTSAKLAFKRAHAALKFHGGRELKPTHLLLGVLAAEAGTVPRALKAAGVNVEALATSAADALD